MESTIMETLKTMLRQRGVNTEVVQSLTSDIPATMFKIDKVVVYLSSRARINDKDIQLIISTTEQNGGNLSIVVVPIPPSSTILSTVRQRSKNIQIFHYGQLQFDITTHRKVPHHRILNDEEKKLLKDKFHIQDISKEMPLIDSQDAVARWIGAVPGDVIEILRKSDTAGTTPYYRMCVADTSL
jgi:DNA-directed RNA polymerase I, II, and III subunit RPABC1